MNKYIESLKEFYENKVKIRKSKSKTIPEIEIEKIPYYYNKDYLHFLENKILEEKGKILIAKYNVYYDLETEIDAYEEIEKNIIMLKEERDRIKFNIERKEDKKIKHIQKLNGDIEVLKRNYSELPEMVDKKIIYAEIGVKREEINSILNNDRCIILKEVNKKKIYTVTTDYEPISGNEITHTLSRSNDNGSNNLGETLENSNGFDEFDGFDESKEEYDLFQMLKGAQSKTQTKAESKAQSKAQSKYVNENDNDNDNEVKPRKIKMSLVSQTGNAKIEPKVGPMAEPKVGPMAGPKAPQTTPQPKPKLKFTSGP